MYEIRQSSAFKKDVKRSKKRNLDITKLQEIVVNLIHGKNLPMKNKDHMLSGNWRGHRECHIEPDWLLIYKVTEGELLLVRTGTHSDLFDM